MSRTTGAVESAWFFVRRHWESVVLSIWLLMVLAMLASGDLWGAIVNLSIGTAVYYGLAKAEAIEKAEQSTTKG